MIGQKDVPHRDELVKYNLAVAGHDGTLCDANGELFIKPCTKQEIEFYEAANRDHPHFADLMPVYFGTLVLNDVTDVNSINEQLPLVADHISQEMKLEAVKLAKESQENVKWNPNRGKRIETSTSVVLGNAAYGYKHPNILDAKLGLRLWADDAPLQKKLRFDEVSKQTTNGSHGFRIAGMRVWRGSERANDLDAGDYKVYDKDYGRLQVNKDNVVSEMRKFIFNPAAGIDDELGKVVAQAFLRDLIKVRDVMRREESRMYSASLLFTFEGDGNALEAAIERSNAKVTRAEDMVARREDASAQATGHVLGRSSVRVDSGIVLDDNCQLMMDPQDSGSKGAVRNGAANVILCPVEEEADKMDFDEMDLEQLETKLDGQDDEGDEGDDEILPTGLGLPGVYSLKLIDFAHARWTPGLGPDLNNIKGVESLIEIFEQLVK